jgi:hypothetical protein
MSAILTIRDVLRLAVHQANSNMEAAGRETWSEDDWRVAREVCQRLQPLIDGDEDVERQP